MRSAFQSSPSEVDGNSRDLHGEMMSFWVPHVILDNYRSCVWMKRVRGREFEKKSDCVPHMAQNEGLVLMV